MRRRNRRAASDGIIDIRIVGGPYRWLPTRFEWNVHRASSGTTNPLTGVFFSDKNTGTIAGDAGTILRTTDGGETWSIQPSGTTANLRSAPHFIDANIGSVVGDGGTILRTTNGGTTWTQQTSGVTNNLRGISFIDALTGSAVGSAGTILRTTSGFSDVKRLVVLR